MVIVMATDMVLKLHSPAGAEPNIFNWPLTSGGQGAESLVVYFYYCFFTVLRLADG